MQKSTKFNSTQKILSSGRLSPQETLNNLAGMLNMQEDTTEGLKVHTFSPEQRDLIRTKILTLLNVIEDEN